ncbi:MAG: TIGR02646 family protein [Candidatus Kapabacteria bacterium]|nr:TIGR02646 family protein [Candidatus Kapabacteria bacterium]
MHRLQRDDQAPGCLDRHKQNRSTWDDVTASDRAEIWAKLEPMQGNRCAYCETNLRTNKRHIEHFRQRSSYPEGAFEWENLFGSCDRGDSCGKHKDRIGSYTNDHLIKPDAEDPEQFLIFTSTGAVRALHALAERERGRANETIRVFGLDCGRLRQQRKAAVSGHVNTAEFFDQASVEYDEEEWMPMLEHELREIEHLPFATAIAHVLTGRN